MASLLRRASIRLGLSPLRHDLFVPPNSRVAVHLTPKVFAERVSINFQRLAAIPTWRTGKWIDSSPNSFLDFQPLKAFSDYFLVVDKPAAVPSIEPADCPESALTPHWLRRVLPRHLSQGYLSVTGRLDAGTHGVMVVSRSAEYTGLFNKVIQARNLTKKYVAVVHGWNSVANARHKRGKWTHFYRKRSDFAQENDLFMHLAPGDATIAEYESDFSKMRFVASAAQDLQHTVPVQLEVTAAREVTSSSVALRCFHPLTVDRMLQQANEAPLTELHIDLLTGKTHQIRAQLRAEGITIVGDWLYGDHELPEPDTFALCCSELAWTCPKTNEAHQFRLR